MVSCFILCCATIIIVVVARMMFASTMDGDSVGDSRLPSRLLYVWGKRYNKSKCPPSSHNDCGMCYSDSDKCLTHAWESEAERQRLFKVAERDHIAVLLLASTEKAKKQLTKTRTCNADLVRTLYLAHNLTQEVYALFSGVKKHIPEIDEIAFVHDWNDNCPQKFDGVALNNEYYREHPDMQCNASDAIEYLNQLQNFSDMAEKAGLPAHFSIGWRWGVCNRTVGNNETETCELKFKWNNSESTTNKTVAQYTADIFSSIDIQVASRWLTVMLDRAKLGYSDQETHEFGKPAYVLVFTSEACEDTCSVSFFPAPCCPFHKDDDQYSESAMFKAINKIEKLTSNLSVGIQSYGKASAYTSGLPCWPLPGDEANSGDSIVDCPGKCHRQNPEQCAVRWRGEAVRGGDLDTRGSTNSHHHRELHESPHCQTMPPKCGNTKSEAVEGLELQEGVNPSLSGYPTQTCDSI